MSDISELYEQVILDHNRNPKNFYEMEDATHSCVGYNPLCGDKLTLYLKILKTDNKSILSNISFFGAGCAISKSSSSLMTDHLMGKDIDEVLETFKIFHNMVLSKPDLECREKFLRKLIIFKGVRKFPSRVKCATLCWHTLMSALDGKEETSTE